MRPGARRRETPNVANRRLIDTPSCRASSPTPTAYCATVEQAAELREQRRWVVHAINGYDSNDSVDRRRKEGRKESVASTMTVP